jgi:hypothetical protein
LIEDDGTYAKTLEKIYCINLIPVVTNRKRPIHPDLYERMAKAGQPLEYARPKPPSKKIQYFALLISIFISTVAIIFY